ncbi:MAG: EAL domain-containing protein, partial [Treponema berlinense]|nr:EAL domain-containing protein [Treponema berlinense]
IYCQGSKDDVMDIVTKLQNISYSLIKKYDLRLFIQNFFGFCPVSSNNDLYEAIARAKITRRIAEYNFEPVLEFDEKYVLDEKENSIAEALANGLKNNEFLVYYQPKFGLTTKTFVGCEALVRWNSKELGFVSPLGFINYAENKGLIHEIDLFVFEQVCIDLADLKKRGKRLLPVSINFSLYEFYCPTQNAVKFTM